MLMKDKKEKKIENPKILKFIMLMVEPLDRKTQKIRKIMNTPYVYKNAMVKKIVVFRKKKKKKIKK